MMVIRDGSEEGGVDSVGTRERGSLLIGIDVA